MKLSFGMIFSIFLIIIFIAFAFYAIKKVVAVQKDVQIKQFMTRLQSNVDTAWRATDSNKVEEYILPTKIKAVCFRNQEENLFFISSSPIPGGKIKHINIEKMTAEKDPFCINTSEGRISLQLKKTYGENLVEITK